MSDRHTTTVRPAGRRTAALAAGVAALALCSVTAAVTATTAHAAPAQRTTAVQRAAHSAPTQRVVPNVGYPIRGEDYVGSYRTTTGQRVQLWCPNPRSTSPTSVKLTATDHLSLYNSHGKLIHVSTVTQARIAYLLRTFGHTTGTSSHARAQGAAMSQAINTFLGNTSDVTRRARSLPAAARSMTRSFVTAATNYAGPYRVTFGAHPAVAAGQSHTSTVALIAHSGMAVPRQRFTLTATGATVTKSVTADVRGTARFTYTATGTGWVRVAAHATNTAGPTVVAAELRRGFQRLLAAGAAHTVSSSFAAHATIKNSSISYTCTSSCNGKPVETVKSCTSAGTATATFTVYDGTRAVSSSTVRQSKRSACTAVKVTVPDAHVLTVKVTYLVHGKKTAAVTVGRAVINCPPPPAVQLSESCACTDATFTATLHNTTSYTQAIVVDGKYSTTQAGKTVSTVVRPGATLTLTYAYGAGHPLDVSVAGAAQRRGTSSWNVGATIRTAIAG